MGQTFKETESMRNSVRRVHHRGVQLTENVTAVDDNAGIIDSSSFT